MALGWNRICVLAFPHGVERASGKWAGGPSRSPALEAVRAPSVFRDCRRPRKRRKKAMDDVGNQKQANCTLVSVKMKLKETQEFRVN